MGSIIRIINSVQDWKICILCYGHYLCNYIIIFYYIICFINMKCIIYILKTQIIEYIYIVPQYTSFRCFY